MRISNGLNEAYSYDSFGNLQQSGNFDFVQAYTANNRVSGYRYDAAGNMLSDGMTNTLVYDANGMVSWDSGTSYYYNPMGDRVGKSGFSATDTVYFGGRPIARLSNGAWTDLIYGTNGLLAEVPGTQNGAPVYRMTDHLGSTVGLLSAAGAVIGAQDTVPFGQLLPGGGAQDTQFPFTELEHDPESGLDHAAYRQYASFAGRWMSPDPYDGSMDLGNPQSLNRYSYVGNNPLLFTDPSGLQYGDPLPPSSGDDCTFCDFFVEAIEGLGSLLGFEHPSLTGDPAGPQARPDARTRISGGTSDQNPLDLPSNLPQGTPQQYWDPFMQGFNSAQKALRKKPCSKYFGGVGPQTMNATQYRFLDMNNPTTGAATVSPDSVFINSTGPYMNYAQPMGKAGFLGRYWSPEMFRGFILLHELGHQLSPITGFVSDAGNRALNEAQSSQVLSHCF